MKSKEQDRQMAEQKQELIQMPSSSTASRSTITCAILAATSSTGSSAVTWFAAQSAAMHFATWTKREGNTTNNPDNLNQISEINDKGKMETAPQFTPTCEPTKFCDCPNCLKCPKLFCLIRIIRQTSWQNPWAIRCPSSSHKSQKMPISVLRVVPFFICSKLKLQTQEFEFLRNAYYCTHTHTVENKFQIFT